jgi:hypothetical protein
MSKHPSPFGSGRTPQQPGVGQVGVGQPSAGQVGVGQPSAGQPSAGQAATGQSAPDTGADELDPRDRALLEAARAELQRDHVPGPVRERLFERTMAEARRVEPPREPGARLVPVRARGVWLVLGSAAAMAAGLVLFANARPLFRGSAGDEPLAGGEAPRPQQRIGDRIFQSALFRAPAPEWSGALPAAETSLFGERPFSPESRAWQLRHWEDLSADPGEPAKYHFDQGALCVTLRSGERVIGGWPWQPNVGQPNAAQPGGADDTAAKAASGAPAPALAAPAPVALSAGRAYRLVFKAWATDPLPAQLLIAVGHSQVPFSAAAGARVDVSTKPEPFVVSFVAKHDDASVGVAFLANAGEGAEPTRVCLSDMTLTERPR